MSAVDVSGTLHALEHLVDANLSRARREYDKQVAKDKPAHPELVLSCEYLEYLRDQARLTRIAAAEQQMAMLDLLEVAS